MITCIESLGRANKINEEIKTEPAEESEDESE